MKCGQKQPFKVNQDYFLIHNVAARQNPNVICESTSQNGLNFQSPKLYLHIKDFLKLKNEGIT